MGLPTVELGVDLGIKKVMVQMLGKGKQSQKCHRIVGLSENLSSDTGVGKVDKVSVYVHETY